MTISIATVATKGGTGKTTTAANLGGILVDLGQRVLLIDADVQPTLSKYYVLENQAPCGLHEVITRGGAIGQDCISKTNIPNLDLIASNVRDESIQAWLANRDDRLVILKRALKSPIIQDQYDFVIIDTQGAIGALQKTAAMAADFLISPVNPGAFSANEFKTGTLQMLEQLNQLADFNSELRPGEVMALINNYDSTMNSEAYIEELRQQFRNHHRIRVLQTMLPHRSVFEYAATARQPVHQIDQKRKDRITIYEQMHQLVWELVPNLRGIYVDQVKAGVNHG